MPIYMSLASDRKRVPSYEPNRDREREREREVELNVLLRGFILEPSLDNFSRRLN